MPSKIPDLFKPHSVATLDSCAQLDKYTKFYDCSKYGTFYVVSTPIGNLEDITFRAIRILKEVNLIAAEDTRYALKLLSHYQIKTPLISCYEHNEESKISLFIDKLSQGFDIGLVSDAGTPLISDPGYRVVKGVIDAGFKVVPIPGTCAAIAGLSVSALPTDSFIFAGFPSRKKGKRILELENLHDVLKKKRSTAIFYESPHRIINLIEDIIEVMGDRDAMVAREMTKHYEEYLRGNLSCILEELKKRATIKGECSLFVSSYSIGEQLDKNRRANNNFDQKNIDILEFSNDKLKQVYDELDRAIIKELESSDIKTSLLAKNFSRKYNIPRQDIYSRILLFKNFNNSKIDPMDKIKPPQSLLSESISSISKK